MSVAFNTTTPATTSATTTAPANPIAPSFNILYHGNCIDGWFAAYIIYSALRQYNPNSSIMMYAISPNLQHTWTPLDKLKGSHVMLADVSIPFHIRNAWLSNGVLSVKCIDHHSTALDHWKGKEATNAIINTEQCAALIAWNQFYSNKPVPEWLLQVDRIDRWDNPTYEDRCLREVLNTIAHLPVQGKLNDAFMLTEHFFRHYDDPVQRAALYSQGAGYLAAKDNKLIELLQAGIIVNITQDLCMSWGLPGEWLGMNVFILNTTNIILDSTEAAYLAFQNIPSINVFVNYRFKNIINQEAGTHKTMVIYSARGRTGSGVDLTKDKVFFGHPTSAGASRTIGEQVCPFINENTLNMPVA
jgi:hypothetical protein